MSTRGQKKIGSISHGEDTEPIHKTQTMNAYWGWAKNGTCLNPNVNSSIFVSNKPKDIAQAKIFCEICPVKQICLEYAIENEEYENVWGGTSGPERLSSYLRQAS